MQISFLRRLAKETKKEPDCQHGVEAKTSLVTSFYTLFHCYVSFSPLSLFFHWEFVECLEIASILCYLKDNLAGLPSQKRNGVSPAVILQLVIEFRQDIFFS